jgi:hypothetical protein
VHHIGAHIRLRAVDQLFDLLQERVDEPSPPGMHERVPPIVTSLDVARHRLRVSPRELGRRVAQRVKSNASRISMISLSDFVTGPPVVLGTARTVEQTPPEGRNRGYDVEIS